MFTRRVKCGCKLVYTTQLIGLMEGQSVVRRADLQQFEITQIMPLLICINDREYPGFRFWSFVRGSRVLNYSRR